LKLFNNRWLLWHLQNKFSPNLRYKSARLSSFSSHQSPSSTDEKTFKDRCNNWYKQQEVRPVELSVDVTSLNPNIIHITVKACWKDEMVTEAFAELLVSSSPPTRLKWMTFVFERL
jgi:hypothetical protein